MLSRSNDGIIIFCENELIEREVLTMQALRTLLDDEDPHPDAYLTVYTHNTVSGVKQAKNRRLALLEQVAGFIAGGGVADKDKLIEDFVARHTPKMANPKARKVDEQIRKNVVTAFNLCPVNKHQQRQTYLRLLLAGNPTVTRPILKSVHKGFGITCGEDAYRTARAAVKDANYVIGTLPEARKQGGKTYERKDPTFQDRVESFWLSPEFTRPDSARQLLGRTSGGAQHCNARRVLAERGGACPVGEGRQRLGGRNIIQGQRQKRHGEGWGREEGDVTVRHRETVISF